MCQLKGWGLWVPGFPMQNKMRAMLSEAGFTSMEVLEDWGHPLNRYYAARP